MIKHSLLIAFDTVYVHANDSKQDLPLTPIVGNILITLVVLLDPEKKI